MVSRRFGSTLRRFTGTGMERRAALDTGDVLTAIAAGWIAWNDRAPLRRLHAGQQRVDAHPDPVGHDAPASPARR